jgi:hypothetical protein
MFIRIAGREFRKQASTLCYPVRPFAPLRGMPEYRSTFEPLRVNGKEEPGASG